MAEMVPAINGTLQRNKAQANPAILKEAVSPLSIPGMVGHHFHRSHRFSRSDRNRPCQGFGLLLAGHEGDGAFGIIIRRSPVRSRPPLPTQTRAYRPEGGELRSAEAAGVTIGVTPRAL